MHEPSSQSRHAHTIAVPTDGSAAEVRRLLDDLDPDRRDLASFAIVDASLDDVFMALTGRRAGAAAIESACPTEAVHV